MSGDKLVSGSKDKAVKGEFGVQKFLFTILTLNECKGTVLDI